MSWGSNGTDQAFMVGEASSEIWVDGSNDFHGFPTPYPISDGNWHFVAVTYTGSTIAVYLDGKEIGTGHFDHTLDTSPPSAPTTGPAVSSYLGQPVPSSYSDATLGQGSLADVAIFPAVLSGANIAEEFADSGYAAPGAPGSVTATAGVNRATVSWHSATASGSTVSSYLVTALKNGTTAGDAIAVPATARSAVVSGLIGGSAYKFEVKAEDSYGWGAEGVSTQAETPTGTSSTYESKVLSNSPTAYYRLGDSTTNVMADSSGHDDNGSYNGPAVTLSQPGAVIGDLNTAAESDGYQGIGSATATLPVDNGARSIEAWIQAPGLADKTRAAIVSWGHPTTDEAFQLLVGGNQIAISNWTTTQVFTTPNQINDGMWHQMAVTYTGKVFTVYLDGKSIGTGSLSTSLATGELTPVRRRQ